MKTIGIYPGNFQPPTKAHLEVYKKLRHVVGPDSFVVTTDRTPTPEAPLNFGDKEQIWVRHGVPASHIQKVDDWKHPIHIFNNFSKDQTAVVYALNQKEAAILSKRKGTANQLKEFIESDVTELAPVDKNKEIWLDNNGQPNYFQPYVGNENSMKPLSENGYVLIVDDSRIDGKPVSTANIRQVLGSSQYDDGGKKKFFRFVFGWFDIGLYTLVTSKFKQAHQVSSDYVKPSSTSPMVRGTKNSMPVPPLTKESVTKSQLQKMVREMLGEILDEEYSTSINTPDSSTNMTSGTEPLKSPAEQRADAAKQKQNLVKQKQEAEAEAKKNKQQRDQYQTTVRAYDSFQKKNDRDKIDGINKQLATNTPPNAVTIGMNAGE